MIIDSAIFKDGQIYTGRRHHNIIHAQPAKFFANDRSFQGFVTDTGEFLDRVQAGIHAIACGQITKLKYHFEELFSEDLW